MKFRHASKRHVRSSVRKGERSSHAKGYPKGYVMDKELQISSGTEFLPKETQGSKEEMYHWWRRVVQMLECLLFNKHAQSSP